MKSAEAAATLEQSYSWCRKIARERARNFYYSFLLLSTQQRSSMCAVYAFMRYCDDLSDEPGAQAATIENWRDSLTKALAGNPEDHPLWPAFCDTVVRYKIPHQYFYEMIEGVLSDLGPRQIRTFEDLYRYCYQVASVVGLAIIHIFGFESPQALQLAEKCGIAFQLTNILRDVREDARLGRMYLPSEDLERFGVQDHDLVAGRKSVAFVKLMSFEATRASRYYQESQPLVELIDHRSRASLWALISIYSRLLERIIQSGFDVLSHRISLSAWEKSWIVMRAAIGATG